MSVNTYTSAAYTFEPAPRWFLANPDAGDEEVVAGGLEVRVVRRTGSLWRTVALIDGRDNERLSIPPRLLREVPGARRFDLKVGDQCVLFNGRERYIVPDESNELVSVVDGQFAPVFPRPKTNDDLTFWWLNDVVEVHRDGMVRRAERPCGCNEGAVRDYDGRKCPACGGSGTLPGHDWR